MSFAAGIHFGYAGPGGSSLPGAASRTPLAFQEDRQMSWETFYFFCFCVGFLCSLVSFLAGTTHLHIHLPRGFHGHVGHPGAGGGKGSAQSPINFGTVAAFL